MKKTVAGGCIAALLIIILSFAAWFGIVWLGWWLLDSAFGLPESPSLIGVVAIGVVGIIIQGIVNGLRKKV